MTAPDSGRGRVRVWLQACVIALLIEVLIFPPGVQAGQIQLQWAGGSGNWTDNTTDGTSTSGGDGWCIGGSIPCSPGSVFPNDSANTYFATIPATLSSSGTAGQVSLDGSSSITTGITVDGLTLGGGPSSATLLLGDNSLTIGTLASPGALLTINGGRSLNIQSAGTLTLQNTASTVVSGPNTSTIVNNGSISLNGATSAATLLLDDGGQGNVFDLTGTGTLFMSGQAQIMGAAGNAAALINDVGHTISGAGTISGLAGNSLAVGFTNNGFINVTNGGAGNNNLTIDTSNVSPSLALPAGFYNTGLINVAGGATLTLSNSSGPSGLGLFVNDGSITLGTGTGAGLVLADSSGQGTPFDIISFSGSGTLNLTGSSTISGKTGYESLINDSGHNINVDADGSTGISTIGNLSGFTNNGTINIGTGTPPSSAASLVIDTTTAPFGFSNAVSGGVSGTINVGDGTQLVFQNTSAQEAVFNNDGVIAVGTSSGASLMLSGSGTTFDLTSGLGTGTVALTGTSGISGQTGGESLINDAGHTISNSGMGSISNLAAFTNNGALSVTSGILKVDSNVNFTNWTAGTLTGGTYSVAPGAALQLAAIGSGVIDTLVNAVVSAGTNGLVNNSGADTLTSISSIQSSQVDLSGVTYNLAPAGGLSITSNQFYVGQSQTSPGLTLDGGSTVTIGASGAGSLTNSVTGAAITAQNQVIVQNGSTLTAGDLLNQTQVSHSGSGLASVGVVNSSTLNLSSLTTYTNAFGASSSVLISNGVSNGAQIPNSGSTLKVTGNVYVGGGSGSPLAPNMSQGSDSLTLQGGSLGIIGGNLSNNNAGTNGASVVEVLSGSKLNVTGTFSQNQGAAGLGVSQFAITGGSTVTVGGLTNSTFYESGIGPQSQVIVNSGSALNVQGANTFTNISSTGVLSGGSYFIGRGSSLNYTGSSDITSIGADTALTLDNLRGIGTTTGSIHNGNTDAISGSLSVNNGSLTLSDDANLTLTAGSFMNNGTLTTSGFGDNLFNVTGDFLNTSPGGINLTSAGDQLYATGTFTNEGTLDIGAGASVRAGTAFDLSAGTLTGDGTLDANLDQTGGTFNPGGDPQSFDITGFYDLDGGILQLDLGSGGIDQLNVTGEVSLDGSLDIDLLNGFVPGPGVYDDVISAGSVDPAFNQLSFSDAIDGLNFALQQDPGNPDSFDLIVTSPEPGSLFLLFGAMLASGFVVYRRRISGSVN